MKHLLTLLFITLIINSVKSQDRFEIRLNAPFLVDDSLTFSTPMARSGFEEFYNFRVDTSKNIKDLKILAGFPFSIYSIKIQKENSLHGDVLYPVPISFMKFDPKKDSLPKITNIIFLEKGKFEVNLPEIANKLDLHVDSPANNEYRALKKQMEHIYVKSTWYDTIDSLINFEEKQKILSAYIKKNPGSFVALWQIIEDYSFFYNHPDYAKNLSLFSEEVKKSYLFKSFEGKITAENATKAGAMMPDIHFDDQLSLIKKDFSKYKLTFVDYWTTTCGPCIRAMPEMVELYNEYKNEGLNVITIADEDTPEKIDLANQILKKNKADWTNFFDTRDVFKNTVNATGYPLQFLIDNNGKIITRVFGNLDEIKKTIDEYLRQSK